MNIQNHPVVSREEWLVARKQHLAHEKAFTRSGTNSAPNAAPCLG